MLILGHAEVGLVLDGQEAAIVDLVRDTYRRHDEGLTAVPRSVFLRFPDAPANRIIGLPAYLGGDDPVAGLKWIASFPGNLAHGLPRASAAIVLNSLRTGQPEALLEGSVISARRTAASAALAAALLTARGRAGAPAGVALVGCGVINAEVLRFLAHTVPTLRRVTLYDRAADRAAAAAERVPELLPGATVTVAPDVPAALAAEPLVSIATTAAEPHTDLTACRPGAVVLHLSLRDLYPSAILAAVNLVDDADHVCRERTSLHLAEQLRGDRGFIAATVGQLVGGTAELPAAGPVPVVFSPFGLGVLDLALARYVRARAEQLGLGTRIDGFLPSAPPGNPQTQPVDPQMASVHPQPRKEHP